MSVQIFAVALWVTVVVVLVTMFAYRQLDNRIRTAYRPGGLNRSETSYYKYISDEIHAVRKMVEDKQIEQDFQIGDHVKVNGEVWTIDSIEKNEELNEVTWMILTGKKVYK